MDAVLPGDASYAIGDLAALGGVSRRTVRYYVQEGLIPPPAGVGRGNHYGPGHLQALLRVKTLQEAGHTLDVIRRAVTAGGAPHAPGDAPSATTRPHRPAVTRSLWRRLVIAAGVELHVDSTADLPSPAALRELDDWCKRHLTVPPYDFDDKERD